MYLLKAYNSWMQVTISLSDLHTPKPTVTTVHVVFYVFTICCLVTAPNNEYSSASMLRTLPTGYHLTTPNRKVKLCYNRWSVSQSVLVSSSHLGPKARFLFLPDSCGFVDVVRPLWQEKGSVVYNCCWSSPAQSFLGLNPTGLRIIFYCVRFETPPTWRARSPYLYRPETQWSSYTPRQRVAFTSPPMTRRDTVEVFEPTSMRGTPHLVSFVLTIWSRHELHIKHSSQQFLYCCVLICCSRNVFWLPWKRIYQGLPSNGGLFSIIILAFMSQYILSRVWVTIDGFWIDNWIYCTLLNNSWLRFT
jgi:hypothetical protein